MACERPGWRGIRDCCDETAARRSAPEPGVRPVEPTGPPHSEYLSRARRLLVSESIPAGYRPADMFRREETSATQAAEPGPHRPLAPHSARLPRAHPCFATHSATPAPDCSPTPLTPSTVFRRPCKWQVPSGRCPSLYAPRIASHRTRPADREPCPLAGYRRTRRPTAVVLRFSIHLPLCSAGFHQLRR